MWKISCFALVTTALLLGACDKPSDKAKREYRMMLKNGASIEARCEKMQAIAAAYLAEENGAEYSMAKLQADVRCHEAALQALR